MAVDNGGVRETGPWASKKFLGLLFAMATNKILLFTGLIVLKDNVETGSMAMWWWMITLTIVDGFLSTGGLLGIAYVDKYVRVAQLVAQSGPYSKSTEPPIETPTT
jgi:hypothetical protein